MDKSLEQLHEKYGRRFRGRKVTRVNGWSIAYLRWLKARGERETAEWLARRRTS